MSDDVWWSSCLNLGKIFEVKVKVDSGPPVGLRLIFWSECGNLALTVTPEVAQQLEASLWAAAMELDAKEVDHVEQEG